MDGLFNSNKRERRKKPLLREYRKERKRARNRIYKARKAGLDVSSLDLPPIPENPTQADIDLLKEISQEIYRQSREDADKYANEEETIDINLLDLVNEAMDKAIRLVQGTEFLGSRKGYAMTGSGKDNAILQDTESDKFDIITYWNNLMDEYTQNNRDARRLLYKIKEKEDELSTLLNDIETVVYKLNDYISMRTKIMKIFDELGAPTAIQAQISKGVNPITDADDSDEDNDEDEYE